MMAEGDEFLSVQHAFLCPDNTVMLVLFRTRIDAEGLRYSENLLARVYCYGVPVTETGEPLYTVPLNTD